MTVDYRTFIKHIPERHHVRRCWEKRDRNEHGLHIRGSINKLAVKIGRRDEHHHTGNKQAS